MVRTRRQAKEKKPALSNMPDNILVEIYKHLPFHQRIQSEIVCRRFRNVLKDHAFRDITKLKYDTMLLWKKSERLRGKSRRYVGKGSIQRLFARCGRYLTEVDVGSFPERLRYLILELLLLSKSPRIKKLRLTYTRLNDSDLLEIGRALPNLTELDLTNNATGCTESAIAEFLQGQAGLRVVNLGWFYAAPTAIKYLPSVEVLNIARCYQINQEDLFSLKDACPNLKDLDISSIDNLMDRALEFDGWNSLEILRFNSLYMPWFEWETETLNRNSLTFKDMPALKECHMQSNRVVNDQTLRTLCSAAPKLVVLDLSGCGSRSGLPGSSHISRLRCLEHLSVGFNRELTEQDLESIVANGRLKHLELNDCRKLGNSAVQVVLDSCKELTFLNLSCISIDMTVLPYFLAYADEFEAGRPKLWVVSNFYGLQKALKDHPKIKCTHDEHSM